MTDEQFTQWLVNEMEIQGISRNKLAKKSGLSISTIRRCVLGIGTPTLYVVGKILAVFGKKMQIIGKDVSE